MPRARIQKNQTSPLYRRIAPCAPVWPMSGHCAGDIGPPGGRGHAPTRRRCQVFHGADGGAAQGACASRGKAPVRAAKASAFFPALLAVSRTSAKIRRRRPPKKPRCSAGRTGGFPRQPDLATMVEPQMQVVNRGSSTFCHGPIALSVCDQAGVDSGAFRDCRRRFISGTAPAAAGDPIARRSALGPQGHGKRGAPAMAVRRPAGSSSAATPAAELVGVGHRSPSSRAAPPPSGRLWAVSGARGGSRR